MTTTTDPAIRETTAGIPAFAVAGAFLEAFAARDLARIAGTLSEDAEMRALVPRGLKEFAGPDLICGAFRTWFVDVDAFDLLDADIGEVGARLHLRWRVRVRAAERLGPGSFLVEQQVYADTDGSGRIARITLLCSGYCPEHTS